MGEFNLADELAIYRKQINKLKKELEEMTLRWKITCEILDEKRETLRRIRRIIDPGDD